VSSIIPSVTQIQHRLRMSENRVLKIIFGPKREAGEIA
jgi:hypothetical protein